MPRNDGQKHWNVDPDAPKYTRGAKLKRRKRMKVKREHLNRLKRKRKKSKGDLERIETLSGMLKGTGLE